MRSGQREAVVVLLHLLDGDIPSPDRVALLAVCAELALMNVGVAILAALANVSEDGLDVALRAGYGLMHSPQGITRLIVVKFGDSADRLPSAGCVAILTWGIQVAVRTVRSCVGLRLDVSRMAGKRKQQHCHQIEYGAGRRHGSPLARNPTKQVRTGIG